MRQNKQILYESFVYDIFKYYTHILTNYDKVGIINTLSLAQKRFLYVFSRIVFCVELVIINLLIGKEITEMATKDTVFLQYQSDIDEYYHSIDLISQLKNDINEAEHEVHELETLEVKLNQKVASANSCVANAKRILQTEEKKLSAAQSSKDNNLLDDTVYSQELARIVKEKNDRIASEKAKIENDAKQKRTSISDRIKKLKDAKKNDKFVIPSSLADKVSSAKSKRAAWDEFFDNASDKGKKIKDRIVGISDPEIQSLAATFHSTNQLINKCNSVKEIENGENLIIARIVSTLLLSHLFLQPSLLGY